MIKAGIIGLGWWGRTIIREMKGNPSIQIVLGIDPDEAGRTAAGEAGLKTAGNFDDALADPAIDALILCSPHRFHASQIIAAAKAGKHVFCEKPLCTSAADADAAIAAVRAAGVKLGIGHERRFEPPILEMRRRVENGDFGTLLSIEANFSQDKFLALPADNWRLSNLEAPVGPLSATGIHLVDLSIAMLGRPKNVLARLSSRGSSFANGDTLSILLTFETGATAMLSAILATPFVGRIAVFGSRGWMEIRDRTHPEHSTGWDLVSVVRGGERETDFHPPHHAVRDNIVAFSKAIADGSAYPVSLEEMALNVKTFEAITRSAGSGQIELV